MVTGASWNKIRLYFLISSARHFKAELEQAGFKVLYEKAVVQTSGRNRFMDVNTTKVDFLVDPKLSFVENFKNISKYCIARGGTSFNVVANSLVSWANSVPSEINIRKEMILSFPVFLVISDGDFNNQSSVKNSVLEFKNIMRNQLGWEGILVVWDCKNSIQETMCKFDGIENVIYYSSFNPNTVTSIFSKIDDLEIIDVYTVLKSLYLMRRYEPVRILVD
jgi:hypothetical protein